MSFREDLRRADFSPDGRRIVVGNSDGAVAVWDAENGVLLARLLAGPKPGEVHTAVFSPDFKSVMVARGQNKLHGLEMSLSTSPSEYTVSIYRIVLAEEVDRLFDEDR